MLLAEHARLALVEVHGDWSADVRAKSPLAETLDRVLTARDQFTAPTDVPQVERPS
jgi:hypothetical protein